MFIVEIAEPVRLIVLVNSRRRAYGDDIAALPARLDRGVANDDFAVVVDVGLVIVNLFLCRRPLGVRQLLIATNKPASVGDLVAWPRRIRLNDPCDQPRRPFFELGAEWLE